MVMRTVPFLLTFILFFASLPVWASEKIPYYLKSDLLTWEYNADKQRFGLNSTPLTPGQVSFIERVPERDHQAGPLTKVALKVHFRGSAAPQMVYVSAFDFRSKTGQITQPATEITLPLESSQPQICSGPIVSVPVLPSPPPPPRIPSSTPINPAYMDAPLPYPQVPIRNQTQYEIIRDQALEDMRTHGESACLTNLRKWEREKLRMEGFGQVQPRLKCFGDCR